MFIYIYIYVYTNTLYISNDILLYLCADRQNIIYIYACYIYIIYICMLYIRYIYIYGVAHIVYFSFPHQAGSRISTRLQRSSAAQAWRGV